MKRRILFLNRSYWPDTEATGQLLTDLAEDLTGRFDVEVLAGSPNHVTGAEFRHADLQQHNGVTIHRTRHSRFSKASKLGKLANLVSFTGSAWWWQRRQTCPDVVVAQTDPFFLPFVANQIRRRTGCRMIVTLQDIYPDVMIGAGLLREGRATRWIRKRLVETYRQADRIVVLSRDMREKCLRWKLPEEKLVIIPNWADTTAICPTKERNGFRAAHGLEHSFVVMYSGNLGYAHLLEPLLDAAEQLSSRPEVQFLLIGNGVQKPRLEQIAAERGLTNVRFLPPQPREQLSQSLSAADVHYVSMHARVADCLMPSKLYGILAAGSPVIAACPLNSELAEIVEDCGVGLVCDAGSKREPVDTNRLAEDLARSICRLVDRPAEARRMGSMARQVAEEKFDRRLQTDMFAQLLEDVLNDASEALSVPVARDTAELMEPHEPRRRKDPSCSDPFLPVPG